MKNRQFNKKGFTLVEIIVSIAIFSAVLAVLGSVMVSGFKYFYETSNTDLDKRSIDQLSSYVREQLLYATDVKIQNSKPEGKWYSISVVDNKLHHYDQDEIDLNAFNNDSYYNGHSFKMTVKAYENNRLDLSYSMLDGTEALYTTRDTLELMNVTSIENAPFADEKIVGQDDLKIYYKKDKTAINNGNVDDTPTVITGTVADQIEWLNIFNTRYYNNIYSETYFSRGDFIFYDGAWWRYIYSSTYQANLTSYYIENGFLKKIDSVFAPNSYYEYGDIVFYPETQLYYKYIGNSQHEVWKTGPVPETGWGSSFWKSIGNKPLNNSNLECGNIEFSVNRKKTVAGKLLDIELNKISEFQQENIYPVCKTPLNPDINDFVKVYNSSSKQYQYYIKIFDSGYNIAPGEVYSSSINNIQVDFVDWQLICVDALSNNAYIGGEKGWYNEQNYFRLLEKNENNGLSWGTNGIGKQNSVFHFNDSNNPYDYYISGAYGYWKSQSY
jgi:prepilin-type N-terminal cleavage/methylation domain-containing protein